MTVELAVHDIDTASLQVGDVFTVSGYRKLIGHAWKGTERVALYSPNELQKWRITAVHPGRISADPVGDDQ